MSTASLVLAGGAFLASAVEMVEVLTIVLALGVTRGYRSTLIGAFSALAVLIVAVIAVRPLLDDIPIDTLRIVVGGLLLVFGLQWLRKAILRAGGYKALNDEELAFKQEVTASERAGHVRKIGLDWYAFTVAFKGVLLEGLEVVFIVLTFGTSHGNVPLAATGAIVGAVVVAIAGFFVHAPLSRVPENTMKFCVGIALTTFGIYWAGEGVQVHWPAGTGALVWILALCAAGSLLLVRVLKARKGDDFGVPAHGTEVGA